MARVDNFSITAMYREMMIPIEVRGRHGHCNDIMVQAVVEY